MNDNKKSNHRRKMVAPIVVAVLFVTYVVLYLSVIVATPASEFPFIYKALFLAIPVALIVVFFYVLKERIKEIKSGEEDDLDKY